jgi:hypothetical protein
VPVKPTLHLDLFPVPKRRGRGKVRPADKPIVESEPVETEAERNRRLWFSGEMQDSLGNVCRDARDKDGVLIQRREDKTSLLGKNPEIQKPAPVQDGSVNPLNIRRVTRGADGYIVDAGGSTKGR